MRVPLNPCYILHQRSYRESSLIIDVFSREYGKLVLVSKGAKRPKSRVRALIQSHQRLYIAWSGKGDMGTLTAIETGGESLNINGRQMMAAFYLDELLMRLLHRHEGHPELFDAYERCLKQLGGGESEQAAIRAFEVQLLKSLGYGLVLDHDADTGAKIDPEKEYYYRINYGPVVVPPQEMNYIKISGKALNALDGNRYGEEDSMKEAKVLIQYILKSHLGPKPLASRELYRAYLRNLGVE